MKKIELETVKKKLKKYAPVVSAATGIVATVYALTVVHQTKNNCIPFTRDDRKLLQEEDGHIRYNIDGQKYHIFHAGNIED